MAVGIREGVVSVRSEEEGDGDDDGGEVPGKGDVV